MKWYHIKKLFLSASLLILASNSGFGQTSPSFTQFFINPYHFNPSYAGIEGRPTLFLKHRRQWMGIEGSPVTSNLSFHMPMNLGLSLGFDFVNDTRGIISSNSALFTFGYVVPFSKKDFLRFGISAGAGFRNLDLDQVENPSDPALVDILDKSAYLSGNFGVSFQRGYFNIGVSLPQIFEPNINTLSGFETGDISPLSEIILNTSYRFYFSGDEMAFEPQLLYRYNQYQPNQFEAAGILHIQHLIWVGGSFRQDYGISALGGIKIKNIFSLGYSYGIGSANLPGIGSSTHEIMLSLFTGKTVAKKKKDKRLFLSFIDTQRFIEKKPERKPAVVATKVEEKPVVTEETKPVQEEKPVPEEVKPVVEEKQIVEEVKTESLPVRDTTWTERTSSTRPRIGIASDIVKVDTGYQVTKKPAEVKVEPKAKSEPVRHEYVNRTSSAGDLLPGSYIVTGVFSVKENAMKQIGTISDLGYPARMGFLNEKGYWYVYVKRADTPDEVKADIDNVRGELNMADAWILTVNDARGETSEKTGQVSIVGEITPTSMEKSKEEEIKPMAGEKHDIVSRGDHMFELLKGHYIVVGVFSTFENAEKYSDQLHRIGQSVKWGYSSEKKYWYAYIYYNNEQDGIKEELDKVRKVPQIGEAWLLTVK